MARDKPLPKSKKQKKKEKYRKSAKRPMALGIYFNLKIALKMLKPHFY